MPVFRFDKALGVAQSVRAFLNPKKVGAEPGAESDAGQREEQAENPESAWRPMSEQKERPKRPGLSRIESERRVAKKQPAERREHKKNKEKIRQGMVDQDVSDKQRDPPPERIETAHLRRLPDFVIIGTQRGGTTSLYRYLTEHPDVGPALRKEVHFFDRHYQKGMNWYLAHFPLREEASMVGEASPNYLFHPEVSGRARGAIPYARFIALLRNPVDRAYSQYQMNVRKGIESLSFQDALDKERERLSRSDDPASPTWRQYSYIKRGLYGEQLERWISVFPREQFLIIKSEDLYTDPEQVVGRTLAYLGLRPWRPSDFKAYHLAQYSDMGPAMRKDLAEYFTPYNRQLYALVGRDLGWEHERQ